MKLENIAVCHTFEHYRFQGQESTQALCNISTVEMRRDVNMHRLFILIEHKYTPRPPKPTSSVLCFVQREKLKGKKNIAFFHG